MNMAALFCTASHSQGEANHQGSAATANTKGPNAARATASHSVGTHHFIFNQSCSSGLQHQFLSGAVAQAHKTRSCKDVQPMTQGTLLFLELPDKICLGCALHLQHMGSELQHSV